MRCRCWLITLMALIAVVLRAEETEAARVVIVANGDDPDSIRLARYYAEKRGLPPDNVIALKLPSGETTTWREFIATLYQPLQDELVRRGWIDGIGVSTTDALGRRKYAMSGHRIAYLVTCRGVPLKIAHDPALPADNPQTAANPAFGTNAAAVDAELALLAQSGTPAAGFVPNPLFRNDRPSALQLQQVVRVSRLDGPSVEDAKRLVDQALAAEATGLIGRSYVDIGGPHAQGDQWLEATVKELAALGFDGDVDRGGGTLAAAARFDAPALYFGWYAGDANGPFVQPGFAFPPGAIALHIHSFSADTVHSPLRGWVGPLVARGVTATFGNVYEPYLQLTHQPQLLLKALARGDTLGAAAAYALPAYSWQAIVVGDPLYRPFKIPFDEQWSRRARLTPEQQTYVTLRQMRRLDAEGSRNQAIWAGLAAQKSNPSVAAMLALADLQQAAGDAAGARLALDWLVERKALSPAEAVPAALGARRLAALGEPKVAVPVWQRVLGQRNLSREARMELLAGALESARAAQDKVQTERWEAELKAISPPSPAPEKK